MLRRFFLTRKEKIRLVQRQFEQGLFGRLEKEDLTKLIRILRLDEDGIHQGALNALEKRIERGQVEIIREIGTWAKLSETTLHDAIERAKAPKDVARERYELAPLGERVLGYFWDALICSVLYVLVGFLVDPSGGRAFNIVGMIIAGLYFFFKDGLNGQSYGKRMVEIKVIGSRSGLPCTYGQSVVRNLLGIVGYIDLFFIFGEKRQRLGDKAARTLVIKVIER